MTTKIDPKKNLSRTRCEVCRQQLHRTARGKTPSTKQKYCSPKCYFSKRKTEFGNCRMCGKRISRSPCGKTPTKDQAYCSVVCVGMARRQGDFCKQGHPFAQFARFLNNKHYCRKCHGIWVEAHRLDHAEKNRQFRLRLRVELMRRLGGPGCACCSEDQYEFLVFDHILGGGRKDRARSGHTGLSWYKDQLKLADPVLLKKLRVLCHNCNNALAFYGSCPHKRILLVGASA